MKIIKGLAAFAFVFGLGHYILWFSGFLASSPGEVSVALILFALMGGCAAMYAASVD